MNDDININIRRENYDEFTEEVKEAVARVVGDIHSRSEGEFDHLAKSSKQQIRNNMQTALTSLMSVFNSHLHDEKRKFSEGVDNIEKSYRREIESQNSRIRSLEEKLDEKGNVQTKVLILDVLLGLSFFIINALRDMGEKAVNVILLVFVSVLFLVRLWLEYQGRRGGRVSKKEFEDKRSNELGRREELVKELKNI